MNQTPLPLVSALFLTYKRAHLLERSLQAFLEITDYPNMELVVSDDGSPQSVQAKIRQFPFDRFVLAERNRGTGANFNAGILHCSGKYILFLQDDWVCKGPPQYMRDAVAVMEANPHIAFLKFYGDIHSTDGRALAGSTELCYEISSRDPRGASIEHVYSDTPHLKSRAAFDCLGPYKEWRDMAQCELEYEARFANQCDYVAGFFPAYYNRLFVHIGAEESFRTSALGYRAHHFLSSWAAPLKRILPGAYESVGKCYRSLKRLISGT